MDKDSKPIPSKAKSSKPVPTSKKEPEKAEHVKSKMPPESTITTPRRHNCAYSNFKPGNPKYLTAPIVSPECKGNVPLGRFGDFVRRRAYMKDLLIKEVEEQRLNPLQEDDGKVAAILKMRQYYEDNPQSTRSLDFLKAHPEFQVAGPNPMRIPHDELTKALEGFTNMQLAHEICLNHDFRLERFKPEEDSMEGRVRTIMKQAYWDTFDEAVTSKKSNQKQAIGVFREMKEMLLQLLLPHNQGMRLRIEEGLHEDTILEEIRLDVLDFHKYSNFIIDTLGQLCCPMRDKQIFALKSLEKPADLFKEILEVMEQMQLDMANFLISQFRPTIMQNCVEYERLKFAQFIELEYRLHEDAIRVTRSWILRHRVDDRVHEYVVAHAFAEILSWKEKEWPETLTLDWVRYFALAEETKRISYIGAIVLGCFNVARPMFLEDDSHVSELEKNNIVLLRSYKIQEALREDLNILLTKEDIIDSKKLKEVLELASEQCIKITNKFMQELQNRELTPSEKDTLRGVVLDLGREDHQVRHLLIRRMQAYVSERIATGGKSRVEFPKALLCIQGEALAVCVELHRIAMHNRAVFHDLYKAIIDDKISRPIFMNENDENWDPMIQKTIDVLRTEASRDLSMRRTAKNEKLESTLDKNGKEIPTIEDGPVVETTPEIEAIIDKIIAETEFVDDYDEYANISEKAAVELLHALNKHDSASIKRQMQKEEDSLKRILEKKHKMRVDLRLTLKAEMGLPIFHKVLNKEPNIHKFCKLLKVYAQEDSEKKANEAKPQDPNTPTTEKPQGSAPPDGKL